MALRLDDLVLSGELFNNRWYSVHGWLEIKGQENPLILQLTGNAGPDLSGWHVRFETRDAQSQRDAADANDDDREAQRRRLKELKIAWQQIGPTGVMSAQGFRPETPPAEGASRPPSGSNESAGEPPRLHLEWQSQNGHVTLDLVDPIVEFVEFTEIKWGVRNPRPRASSPVEELDDDGTAGSLAELGAELPLEVTGEDTDLYLPEFESEDENDEGSEYENGDDEDSDLEGEWEDDEDEDDDPYGLFPRDLEQQLEPADAAEPWASDVEGDEETNETIREMELMDELIENSPGEPVGEIFDRPVRLPLPADIDDAQAEEALKSLLAELALFGVALDICEHYTPRDAYHLLIEEICKEQRVYPELRQTQWVQQFMTSEFCAACDAEFQREYEEQERNRRESGDPPEDDIPF